MAIHLTAHHAKVVQAQNSADAVSGGTFLLMLEPVSQSEDSNVILPTYILQPNSDGYLKALIKNHGVFFCASRSCTCCEVTVIM